MNYYTGNMYTFFWFAYVGVPILDYILPIDHSNISPERAKLFEKDVRFIVPLYCFFFFELIVYFVVMYYLSIGVIGTTTLSFVMYSFCYA